MPAHETLVRRVRQLIVTGSIAGGVILTTTGNAEAADCSVDDYQVRTDSSQTSDDAECIQATLNELGYDSGPVDGWFGPVTEGAVSHYQTDNGLTVDGQVGAETAGALGVWISGGQSSDSSADAEPSDTSDSSNSDSENASDESADDSSSSDGDQGGQDTAGVYEPWISLANCESGGNWSIDTGNGYYGGLQFAWGSWEAAGGSGNPAHASPSEQVARGEILQDMQGWGAWPTCARQIGLL